jgi:hypothetical protein
MRAHGPVFGASRRFLAGPLQGIKHISIECIYALSELLIVDCEVEKYLIHFSCSGNLMTTLKKEKCI